MGPLLFLIYISDLDDDITSKMLKFADDTKSFRKVKQDGASEHLQDDLDKYTKWSEKDRCYFILVNVIVFTQTMGMKMYIIQWVEEFLVLPQQKRI